MPEPIHPPDQLDDIQMITDDRPPYCEDVGGVAGSGKTYSILRATEADPSYGILCATTGIAAVNLGATTLHSLLRFFDTASARDWYLTGGMVKILHSLAKRYQRLIIDEKSMLDGDLLDIIVRAVTEANRFHDVPAPMGIMLVGDVAQLPPVRAKWIFESRSWERFHSRVLTQVWRQNDIGFVNALNAIRRGDGQAGADMLNNMGARWESQMDTEFEGTTIVPKNEQVARFNFMSLARIAGPEIRVPSRRWGQQRPEWGANRRTNEWGIPPVLEVKVGAYVMLLANKSDGGGGFVYVNGDCGHITEYRKEQRMFKVRLVRNGEEVEVTPVVRAVDFPEMPFDWPGDAIELRGSEDDGRYLARTHRRVKAKKYVTGQVEYFPMRLAYATTVHKSQSLTLDRVQVDFRGTFMASPGMLYVALSRCRTMAGLRLVGQRDVFARRCQIDPRIRPWL